MKSSSSPSNYRRPWVQTAIVAFVALLGVLGPPAATAQLWATPPIVEPGSPIRAEREASFQARLQHLSDGDSFVVRADDGRRVTIRLSAIDAPEKSQAHGDASRRSLRALIENQPLTIEPIKRDPYGRTVARVLVGDIDVGLEQVKAGMAWYYKRYEADLSVRERRDYSTQEARARSARLGLWADDDPLPPWRYREQQRRGSAPGTAASSPRLGWSTDSPMYDTSNAIRESQSFTGLSRLCLSVS